MPYDAIIWTEGKTDSQHLRRAQLELGINHTFLFEPASGDDMGQEQLLKQCRAMAKVAQPVPTIFLFDRDTPDTVRNVETDNGEPKNWGNNVFSLAIPVPDHRSNTPGVCIELCYNNDELTALDESGRRLFLSSEFNVMSGKHLKDPTLSIGNKGKLPKSGASVLKIVDSDVYNLNHENVALSKADFAAKVAAASGNFASLNFDGFRDLFTKIKHVLESTGKVDLCFMGMDSFIEEVLNNSEKIIQLHDTTEALIRVSKLASMIFICSTIKYYSTDKTEVLNVNQKNLKLIQQTITQDFTAPSLHTLVRLLRYCYHIVDEQAPQVLQELRSLMTESIRLGSIGALLEDLERIFPPDRRRGIRVNKEALKGALLEYLLPELAKYEPRIVTLYEIAADNALEKADPRVWTDALRSFLDLLAPISNLTFRFGTIDSVRLDKDQIVVNLTTFQNGRTYNQTDLREYEDLGADQVDTTEMNINSTDDIHWINMFPFLKIFENRLYCYNRTRIIGYEFRPAFGNKVQIVPTKRKFNHTVLGSAIAADRQALFFAPVIPTMSPSGTRANIPIHDPTGFVGRNQQITDIVEEIIRIPNQHGLIHGPGGVGKTALLIELSRKLFENELQLTAPFKNIIWVSAKRDFYDAKLDLVEPRAQQFRSLDQIWTNILQFHDFDDAEGYKPDERKWLVLELLSEEKTLLILDNFESVSSRVAQEEIIRFFGVEAKRYLAEKPDNCKVILTSREIIPSGFHQIALKGLDRRDADSLMSQLFHPYRQSGQVALTQSQRNQVFDVTLGIPLIIKHCFGQIFEYSRSLEQVLENLRHSGTKVVEFSFSEIFKLLNSDTTQREIMILLEVVNRPMLRRQICDTLSIDDGVVAEKTEMLARFQCVIRGSFDAEETYSVTPDIRLLATKLVHEEPSLAAQIRHNWIQMESEKFLDYSKEEENVVMIFDGYVANEEFVHADDFMKSKLKDKPNSILWNLHYAKFLRDVKRQLPEAIECLERIRERSNNHISILRLLTEYYVALDPPNFEQSHVYAKELEQRKNLDDETIMILANFYASWSTSLKQKGEMDPVKDIIRQHRYKDLAGISIDLLINIKEKNRTHAWYYLLSRCQFNQWNNMKSLQSIEQAMTQLPPASSSSHPYGKFREEIQRMIRKSRQ
jgi:Cdc6-like AAA superfamily ATPase